ncbi:MAG: hypothetical protein K6G22_15525 [Lachnospiraceae bacterium]|nr:hypothetical protein [Lachnospiraceae bacterium]
MRKSFLFVAFVMSIVLSGCAGLDNLMGKFSTEKNTNIANPWIDCATIEDAEKIAGYDIMVPDRIEGYPDTFIQAVKKEMIQVFYYDAKENEDERSRVLIRKGVGNEDISGDYNEYSQIESAEMHGINVDLRGNDNLIYNATWYQGGYAYAILSDEGLSRDLIEFFVEIIK